MLRLLKENVVIKTFDPHNIKNPILKKNRHQWTRSGIQSVKYPIIFNT